MHICISKLNIIGSDNGLAPGRCQAIIWTNAGILLIKPLGINFSELLIKIHAFSLKKMHLKMLSGKWHPFCLSLNVIYSLYVLLCCALFKTSWIWTMSQGLTTSPKIFSTCILTTKFMLPWPEVKQKQSIPKSWWKISKNLRIFKFYQDSTVLHVYTTTACFSLTSYRVTWPH